MGKIIYLTGPVRSGKSRLAVSLATGWGDNVIFIPTYRSEGEDAEMEERIRRHRAERPRWRVLEDVDDIGEILARIQPPPTGVVIDCLTLWAGVRFGDSDEKIVSDWRGQLEYFAAASWPTVIVGNEVGWSLVPVERDLRRFRDLVGTLGQMTAAVADEAWLLVAGCSLRLK